MFAVAAAFMLAGVMSASTVHAKCPKACNQEFATTKKACKQSCKGTTGTAKRACKLACKTAFKASKAKCKGATSTPTPPGCSPSGAFLDD
jgi:hypothetical protein